MSADTSDQPTDRPDPGRSPVPYKDRELRYVNDPGRHDDEDPAGCSTTPTPRMNGSSPTDDFSWRWRNLPDIAATDRCPDCGHHLRTRIFNVPYCENCRWAAHLTRGATSDA